MRFDKEINQIYKKMQSMLTVRNGRLRELKPDYHEFVAVLSEIEAAIDQMHAPMRVAIAGYMKAGKSTLMNAILKRKVVLTGSMITTYTPTWFRYNEKESLEIVFEDGHRISGLPLSELENWTSIQSRDSNSKIDEVSYVILNYPEDILKEIELIDTPGLFSPEEKDSERTICLLGLDDIAQANQVGQSHVSFADAIVYVFSSNFKTSDMSAVKAFTSTPINAIAVFTKLEQSFWNPLTPVISPFDNMKSVVTRNEEALKSDIYCILPVVSIMVEGFSQITDEDWEQLQMIAKAPNEQLVKSLLSPKTFEKTELEGTSQKSRLRLYQLLDRYGIYCVVQGIQNGVLRDEMLDYLYSVSGVEELVSMLKEHFGLRAFIIKTEAVFARLERQIQKIKYAVDCSAIAKKMCVQLEQELEEGRNLREFRELTLLRRFYEGEIHFPRKEDNDAFIRLMGEEGNGAAKKLGVCSGASIEELQRTVISIHTYWSRLANDETLERAEKNAAQSVLESVGDMRYHIEMLSGF